MRLLQTSNLRFKEVEDSSTVSYAILSHTWGDEEVTYRDLLVDDATVKTKQGYKKLLGTRKQARKDNFEYFWVDTCCIDKSSSTELSEAINSMYRWYRNARICYVYMVDVIPQDGDENENDRLFAQSKWFSRGWTLQELIAPNEVVFFSSDWSFIRRKATCSDMLSRITGIDEDVLLGADFRLMSIAARMSWASKRETTKLEDQAYCLLGIFDVNMPMLYGEGRRAFLRLQQEIVKIADDHSIFSWGLRVSDIDIEADKGIFAASPQAFAACKDVISFRPRDHSYSKGYMLTNLGLKIRLPLEQFKSSSKDKQRWMNGVIYALLNCRMKDEPFKQLALPLCQRDWRLKNGEYSRMPLVLRQVPYNERDMYVEQPIVMTAFYPLPDHDLMYGNSLKFWVRSMPTKERGFQLQEVYPSQTWNEKTRNLSHKERVMRRSVTWRAIMRFQTPGPNELLVSFQHGPDRGVGRRATIEAYTLKGSAGVPLADLCTHTSEFDFTIDEDKATVGHRGVQLRSEIEFRLGQDTCIVDIMTPLMQFARYLSITNCALRRIASWLTRESHVELDSMTANEIKVVSTLVFLFSLGCSCIPVLVAWWIKYRKVQLVTYLLLLVRLKRKGNSAARND